VARAEPVGLGRLQQPLAAGAQEKLAQLRAEMTENKRKAAAAVSPRVPQLIRSSPAAHGSF
jgi:hypothetical protein